MVDYAGHPALVDSHDVFAVVTPADGADLPGGVCRKLIVAVGGTLKVTLSDGVTTASMTVPAGVLPLRASRVWATGTAATGITALY